MRMVIETRYRLVRPVCSCESDSPAPVMLCTSGLLGLDTPLRYDDCANPAGRELRTLVGGGACAEGRLL